MSREIDRRNFNVNKVTTARTAELHTFAAAVSTRLPGAHRIQITGFDTATGNPSIITSESAPAEKGNYIQRALDHVRNISPSLGLTATQPVEFVADPHIQETTSGAVTVHLQQNYKGIPIFHATQAVRFAPDGALKDAVGSSAATVQEVAVAPKLSVQEAVLKAAQHVAVPAADEQGATDQFGETVRLTQVDLTGFVPKVIATFPDRADRPTVLEAGPFGDEIKGALVWFPLGDELRLAWDFVIAMPNYESQYRTIADADNGEILYCHQLVKYQMAVSGNIHRIDGGGARQMTDFPRPLADYGLPMPANLPVGFPDGWIATDSTIGNATNAHQGVNGSTFQGTMQNGVLTFDPANTNGVDQEVLNIFYYCCYMHDYFYLLGFREADGNFQQDNFDRGGVQSDRVDARSHPGAVTGTANMFTPVDGSNPTMNMGLVTRTNRHTALDSTVVFHEFTHGVTNRLVGGPQNVNALDDPQSGGMGEGWGDYIACTINNVTVLGNWVLNNTNGIRNFPYDSDYPHNYGDVGRLVDGIDYTEVHNLGEIWCATLMEMNRNVGATLGVQLVVDALKLSPANPSFLDMRDAILRALDDMLAAGRLSSAQHTATRRGIWVAFAKFGMGICARSNGASLTGIVADFNTNGGDWSFAGNTAGFGHAINDGRPFWIGDFTGDGRSDVLMYYPGDDNWWLGAHDGNQLQWSFVGNTAGFGHAINEDRPFWIGDFNGDGRSDVLFYYPGDDNWWLGVHDGNQLQWSFVGNTAGFGHAINEDRPFWIGNFSRADRAQVLFYYPGDDNWWLGSYDGNQLQWSFVGNTAGFGHAINEDRPFWIGDFNGDGRSDVLFYYPGDDNWWLGVHDGNQLQWSFVGNTAGFGHAINEDRPFWIGNFSRADRVQVLFYYPGDDNWWLGSYDGNQLQWSFVGNTAGFGHAINEDRPFWIGDFNGDGRSDVLFYYPGDDNWWRGSHDGNQLQWTFTGCTCGFGHAINEDRPFWIGNFSRADRTQVLFYSPADDNWWLGTHDR